MYRHTVRVLVCLLVLGVSLGGVAAFSQEQQEPPDAPDALEAPLAPEPSEEAAVPAIVIEGQDAVSTNFAPEPVQLFGAGGNLTLQLNEASLLSDAPFYADFVFVAEQAGEYHLWYGGSLPGAADPLLASYGSPFNITINDEEPLTITAETVRTGPVYSTPYRWIKAGTITLQEGEHRLRVTVDQRRRYDSRYFLYLDRFVLHSAGTALPYLPEEEELLEEPESIEDLLILLRDEPTNIEAYLQLAHLYTLVGDHINALRYLGRAQILDPQNPALLQAVARNTIWRGDLESGLGAYWNLVSAAPDRIESFLEAGKIAAWSGFLGASEQFHLAGLSHHANDLRLLVNLGFTYLWWDREEQARDYFTRAERRATTPAAILALGAEYRINQAPQREEALYREGLRTFPDSLEIAEQLYSALLRQGKRDEAREHRRAVEGRLPAAADALARIERRFTLREEVIADYEAAVLENPEDLVARAELAQTYFWIGRRAEGIRVYRNLLAAQTQRALHAEWASVEEHIWRAVYNTLAQYLMRPLLGEIASDSAALATAVQTYRTLQQQEGADLAPTRSTIVTTATRLSEAIRVATTVQDLYSGAIEPVTEAAGEYRDARTAELEAVRERLNWQPPVDILVEELNRASDIRNNRRTARILDTLVGPAPDVPAPAEIAQMVSSEDEGERRALRREAPVLLALTARHQGRAAAARLWYDLEEFLLAQGRPAEPAADNDLDEVDAEEDETNSEANEVTEARGVPASLIVFSELMRGPAGRRLGLPAVSDDPLPEWVFDLEAAAALAEEGTRRSGELAATVRQLEQHDRLFREILDRATELALFYLQTNTAPERNRLGELLIEEGELADAVVQLEMVRAVDPDNLATLYILAQAYRRQGQWRRAQNLFAAIHRRDSAFRNTIALHNQIARQYADEFWGRMSVVTEPQRQETRTTMEYLWRINSRYSIRGSLEAGTVRTKIPDFFEDETVGVAYTRRSVYQDYAVRVGVPFHLRPDRLTLEPVLGARLIAHNLYFGTRPEGITEIWDGADLFGSYRLEPEPGLRWEFTTRELYLAGSYRFGVYTANLDIPLETSQLERPVFRSHMLRSDLSWDLRSRPDPLWTRYSQRTGGVAEVITADTSVEGVRYRLAQEFRYGILRRPEPLTRIGIALTAEFEDYQGEESRWYYRPDKVFDTGLRVDWQAYRPIATDTSWGVSGSLYGGYYQTRIGEGEDDPAIRTVGRLTGELTRRNVAFQLGISGSRVLGTGDIGSFPDDGGYYDFGVTFTVVGRNFSLLTR